MYKVVTFFDTPQAIEGAINQYVATHTGARLISCSFVYYGGEFTNAQAYCVFYAPSEDSV